MSTTSVPSTFWSQVGSRLVIDDLLLVPFLAVVKRTGHCRPDDNGSLNDNDNNDDDGISCDIDDNVDDDDDENDANGCQKCRTRKSFLETIVCFDNKIPIRQQCRWHTAGDNPKSVSTWIMSCWIFLPTTIKDHHGIEENRNCSHNLWGQFNKRYLNLLVVGSCLALYVITWNASF